MPLLLTNQIDNYDEVVDNTEIHALNGDDLVSVTGNGNDVFGENGIDALTAIGMGNSLDGGNGDDYLRSSITNGTADIAGILLTGNANVLLGQNGDDFFVSTGLYNSGAYGTGADITGGRGSDTYWFRQSDDVLSTFMPLRDVGTPISDGETLHGVFDVIQDYHAGEAVDVGTTTEDSDGPEVGGINYIPGHTHVVVDEGTYAFVPGDLTGDGVFEVSEEGADTLLIYDSDPNGEFYFEYSGSVVFLGVSDPSQINIVSTGFALA